LAICDNALSTGDLFGMRFDDFSRVRLDSVKCIYCGDISTTEEHYPPASYSYKGYILSACKECNCLASDKFPDNFTFRFDFVKYRLLKRYKHLYKLYEYSNDELEELNGNLREVCSLWLSAKKLIQKRLAWSVQDYFDLIDQDNPFVLINAVSPGITQNESVLLTNIKQTKVSNIKCIICSIEFYNKQPNAKICSLECRRQHNRNYRSKVV
jgi:hypothetical protein